MYKENYPAFKGAWITFRFGSAVAGLKLYNPQDGIFTLQQIHSDKVVILNEEQSREGDAIITTRRNFPIGVKTADCVPIAFLGKDAVGVVHAGWRGIKAGIIEKFLNKFLEFENDFLVFVGPSAKACCYEVGHEFKNGFKYLHYRNGRLFLDTQLEVLEKLKDAGVTKIVMYKQCTICNSRFPSYRRNKTTKRMVLYAILT